MELLLLAVLLGLIPATIAQRKGYGFGDYWIFGALLFIVALPVALLRKPNPEKQRECPACRSWIDRQARVCARCGRDVPEPAPLPQPVRPWKRPVPGQHETAPLPGDGAAGRQNEAG